MNIKITILIFFLSIIFFKVSYTQIWQPTSLTGEYIKCLAVNPSNGYIYAGSLYSQGIFRSTDNGSSWVVTNNGLTVHEVYSIAINPSGHLFVATWGGGMYRSTNNGDTWTQINNGITNSVLFSVTVNPINGYIFAGSGGSGIYRSVDQGNNWTLVNNGLTSYNILSLAVNVNGYIFAGTYDGVFRSTDNGETWAPTSIISGWGESFATNSPVYNIFAAVHTQGVFRSSDNGDTFTLVNNGLTQNSVFAIANTAFGYVYAGIFGGGGIFLSTNNGDSWTENNAGLTNGDVRAIAIAPNGYVFVGTFGGGVFMSTNPIPVELINFSASLIDASVRLNWQTATETNNSGFEIQRFKDYKIEGLNDWETIGFVQGSGTTTEPQTYSFIDNLSLTLNLTHTLKYRLKQIDFDGTITYSNEIEVDFTLKEFVLYQNYPNPFNPATTIQFAISSRQFVSLRVFDILGNEIAALVNEEKQAGVYEVQFNAGSENLTSGVYYYQLRAGNYVETKKMILMR